MSLEIFEYICLELVHRILNQEIDTFLNETNFIDSQDLILNFSSQSGGRSTTSYSYSKKELITAYGNQSLNEEQDLELKEKIASNSIFNIAVERFVFNSIIDYFISNNLDYNIYYSPRSADFVARIDINSFNLILNFFGIDIKFKHNFDGILLHIDSKSTMALSNLTDSRTINKILGKFEANFNQISYRPPKLRAAKISNNSNLDLKYHVLESSKLIDNNLYFVVSLFVIDFVYLTFPSRFFDLNISEINSSYFNHQLFCVAFPNGKFQSDYYDSYFQSGKEGYEDYNQNGETYKYPKDCRYTIFNNGNDFLIFENLENRPLRFHYIPYNPAIYNISVLTDIQQIEGKKVNIPEI